MTLVAGGYPRPGHQADPHRGWAGDQEIGTGRAVPDLHLPDKPGAPDNCLSLPARIRWCCSPSAAVVSQGAAVLPRLLELQADAEVAHDRSVSLSVDPP